MDKQILSICIQEAGRIVTGLLSLPRDKKPHIVEGKPPESPPQLDMKVMQDESTDDKIKKGVACLPCTNSHLLTCRGLLDEAHRMSHDGLTTDGMQRIDQCLGEIAAAERVDLAPSNIEQLPQDEQIIARTAAKEIRNIRHDLEGITEPLVLERAAAKTTQLQKYVSGEFIKIRLSKMTPAEKSRFNKAVEDNLKEDVGGAG